MLYNFILEIQKSAKDKKDNDYNNEKLVGIHVCLFAAFLSRKEYNDEDKDEEKYTNLGYARCKAIFVSILHMVFKKKDVIIDDVIRDTKSYIDIYKTLEDVPQEIEVENNNSDMSIFFDDEIDYKGLNDKISLEEISGQIVEIGLEYKKFKDNMKSFKVSESEKKDVNQSDIDVLLEKILEKILEIEKLHDDYLSVVLDSYISCILNMLKLQSEDEVGLRIKNDMLFMINAFKRRNESYEDIKGGKITYVLIAIGDDNIFDLIYKFMEDGFSAIMSILDFYIKGYKLIEFFKKTKDLVRFVEKSTSDINLLNTDDKDRLNLESQKLNRLKKDLLNDMKFILRSLDVKLSRGIAKEGTDKERIAQEEIY